MQWRRSLHSGLTGKNGCHHALKETTDFESSPSGCSDEGRCTPDLPGKTAVTSLRERRLISRVHLLDAVTKVVALRTERGKWLSPCFDRDACSREFIFWIQWRRSLQSRLNRKNGCLHISIETPDPQFSPSGCSDEGRCTPDWTGKKVLYPRLEREGWSLEFTFRMQWRRSLHSGLNGENGCHHYSRETPDLESSPSRDAWSWEFTFRMHWRRSLHSVLNGKTAVTSLRERRLIPRVHLVDAVKIVVGLRTERENGFHHASRETPDLESSPSGCSDEGRCTPDWTGKTAVTSLRERRLIPRVHLLDAVTKVITLRTEREKIGCYFASRETPDLESSPSGCSDEGHCTPDWTGKIGCYFTSRETPDL